MAVCEIVGPEETVSVCEQTSAVDVVTDMA